MALQKRTLAFVSGNEEEQERQIDVIKNDLWGNWVKPQSDDHYFTDWDAMMKELRQGDCVVVTDLRVLGEDCHSLAERMLLFIERRQSLDFALVDTKQNKKWEKFRDECSGKNPRDRLLLGLRMLCSDMLQAGDAPMG